MLYQIGDFSRICRLSIKTLRYYQEYGLLPPAAIDEDTGYRFYDEKALERVHIIHELKELDFTLKDIRDMLDKCSDDADIVHQAVEKSREIDKKMAEYAAMQRKLESFIEKVRNEEDSKMTSRKEIIIKDVPDQLAASIRFQGRYGKVGQYFGKLYRECGRFCAGAPFSLYYDREYKEEAADIEACIPVSRKPASGTVACRLLQGGQAVTILHHGSYESIGESYRQLFDYMNEHRIKALSPTREVYVKGPGMIFPRSPKKFITEIQILVDCSG